LFAIGILVFGTVVIAYNIASYSKTYQFTSAGPSGGQWVFNLVGGKTLDIGQGYAQVNVNQTEMADGGYIKVGYSFIGYPVSVDYSP